MNKTFQKVVVVVFFAIIFLFAGALLINHDKVVSNTENRVLATFPELNWQTIKSGKFMDGFETFVNDQMTGRDWFVRLSTRTKIAMGQKDINGVYVDGDKLYSKVNNLTQDDLDKVDKSMSQLIKFLQNTPNAYFGIIPTSVEMSGVSYPNKLNQQEFINDVYEQLPTEQLLNLYDELYRHKDEDIYYNTDHHWTTLGAYYAYETIGNALELDIPKRTDYTTTVVKNDFTGTTQAKLNINLSEDTIETWELRDNSYTRVINDITTFDSLYDMEKLTSSEPYAVFLGGNNGKVVVTNHNITEDRKGTHLLMIKDSYSHCLTPFLLENYETVTLIDLRYAGMVSVQTLIKQYNFDEIIILYNTENFISETKFLLLNR